MQKLISGKTYCKAADISEDCLMTFFPIRLLVSLCIVKETRSLGRLAWDNPEGKWKRLTSMESWCPLKRSFAIRKWCMPHSP